MPAITIDYPERGSVFPPEITSPTFLWRDPEAAATSWRIDVSFAGGAPEIHTSSRGERLRIGEIDPRCVAPTNSPPALTPAQAEAHTWVPETALWKAIKRNSVAGTATITITGYGRTDPDRPLSRGRVTISTSSDPVGAPIFYRDVPLMPTETERGVIEPLARHAVRLVSWRVRDIGQPRSRLVMDNLPMCGNCHSFSSDGTTMGMDMDGLQNNRGMYALARVEPEMSIGKSDLIQWRSEQRELRGRYRVGFMSQVSPDGRHVVTTLNPASLGEKRGTAVEQGRLQTPAGNYYVSNFTDYRFLQVFYPTRGILSWYSRETGILQPLPGADDPDYVQMGGVWSPDGKYLVFARARARDPMPPGVPLARFANDPNETQIQYDLYRIPFNGGRGGTPEAIEGASHNGRSNSFPKISPDGRWIVFVQCRNGLLMRPDSLLYIVPAAGGKARLMRCNTPLMNSWHSFSPNGRWLVFSSKSRSPYTQMYLTHIDPDGNDSPPILVENATAANRAVNIPEFVNVPPGGLRRIGGPAIEFYRLCDRAAFLQKQGRYEEAVAAWRKVLALRPDEPLVHSNLSMALLMTGSRAEAGEHYRKGLELKHRSAVRSDPQDPAAHYHLGLALARQGNDDEAISEWRTALQMDPAYAEPRVSLAAALYAQGKHAEALVLWRQAVEIRPRYAVALKQLARALATCPEPSLRDGDEALALARRAVELTGTKDAEALDSLALAYAFKGELADAARAARRAMALADAEGLQTLADDLRRRIAAYEAPAR